MTMNDDRVIGMVIAMEVEALPLIKYYNMQEEVVDNFSVYSNEKIKLIISGVGIINSTLATFVLINRYRCSKIINYGVAGFTGDMYKQCNIFSVANVYKRDVDFTALGYERYQFPEKSSFISLEVDERLPILDCYTSDEYISPKSDVPQNVLVDMEAYCVAEVCRRYEVPCIVYKSISDNTTDSDTQGQIDRFLHNAVDTINDYIINVVIEKQCGSVK